MNRKLVNGLLLVALASSGCGMFTSCKDTDEDFKTDIEFGQEALAQRLKALEDKLAGFPDNFALKQAVIDALNNKADKAVVDDLEKRVEYLLSALDERINNLITDIILQQTWNPMFGSINLPVGLNSTAVVNYYGYSDHAFSFPGQADYEVTDENSGVADIDAIYDGEKFEADGVYMNTNDEGKGSLGMLYVSLNPTSIDPDPAKIAFSLVNSKGDKKIEGLELKASEKELMFGKQSRAAAENGFYETEILIDPADAEEYKIRIEENLKSAMKDALKNHTKSDFATLAKVLYDQMKDVTPAYALKAEWTTNPTAWIPEGTEVKTEVDWEDGYKYDYVSNVNTTLPENKVNNVYIGKYEIAAATVKPLGYKFGEDLGGKFPKLPTIGSVEEAINSVLKDLNINIDPEKVNFDGNGMKIVINLDGVVEPEYAGDVKEIVLTYDPSVNEVTGGEGALNDLVKKINDSLKGVVTDINGSIDESIKNIKNSLLGKASKFDNLLSKYNSLANRINNFLKNPNQYLQVMMAYQGVDGQLHQMSANKAFPTVVKAGNGSIELYLTSYTSEIIAPSCKKYVAVVAGPAKDAINGEEYFNTILPGNQQVVALDASKLTAGDYEIVYSSLDYHGYTSTRKYYFTVK